MAWRDRFEVTAFEGSCPRCGAPLPLPPGSKIHLPYRFDCLNCHFRPELEVSGAAEG